MLQLVHDVLERIDLVLRLRLEPEDDIAIHLHEATIAVPAEALVARLLDEPFERGLVETEVEHGVHHPRHGDAGTGAAGDEQRVLRITEFRAHRLLGLAERLVDLPLHLGRILVVVGDVGVANLGGECEAGGDGQPDIGHLGEVGALAAEQILHVGPALGLAGTEEVDVLGHEQCFLCRTRAPSPPGWHALRYSEGRRAFASVPCPSENLGACHSQPFAKRFSSRADCPFFQTLSGFAGGGYNGENV